MIDLTVIWASIIGFAIIAYVVMDGFDLGIGILFPFFKVGKDRDTAMNSIAPVWDGNETWLVMGVGGLLAAFPLAYAIILPALYAPMIAMLLGLVFRGVVQSVADNRGLDPSAIMDMSRRRRDVCEARWMVWRQLVFIHKWSRAKVARRFCCDHTTVMHGLARAEKLWGPIEQGPQN